VPGAGLCSRAGRFGREWWRRTQCLPAPNARLLYASETHLYITVSLGNVSTILFEVTKLP